MKILKFNKVAGSANDAGVFHYVPASEVKLILTADTSVVVYFEGFGSDVLGNDTMTFVCATGDEDVIADKLANVLYGSKSSAQGGTYLIDKDFYTGISAITYGAVV